MIRDFNGNIRNDDTGVWFTREELDGVPDQELARFPKAESREDGLGRYDSMFVRCVRADVNAVLQYARSSVTRKKIYIANERRVPQNVDLFKEIVSRRDTMARQLGYSSHADFRLETTVAREPSWVNDLLDKLEDLLRPKAHQEMREIRSIRQLEDTNADDDIPPWDYMYYERLVSESLNIKHTEISEFFPLENTVMAMLEVFSSCLQLKFVQISPEVLAASIYHDDNRVWSVWDTREAANGDFIGYLYTDLLWRTGKHTGSMDINIQAGYVKQDGSRVYLTTILHCAFPRPTATSCALLKHIEVVSLFHELGHGIHDLVSRTSISRFHGCNMSPDFFEIPSLMLENWCWMSDELRRMSCHYTTLRPEYLDRWREEHPGQPDPPGKIPEDMLDGLVKSRNVHRALWLLRQLAFARFDMTVHNPSSHEECISLDHTKAWNDIHLRLRMLSSRGVEDLGHGQSSFHHLVSGMDAGYYSYLSSAVIAADIFYNTFAKDPRDQDSWERYRHAMLEPGGSRYELEMVYGFLGHAPDSKYLARSLTITCELSDD